VAADHLVANLHQVGGIEKRVVGKQCVADRFGMGVERAIARERVPLPICGPCLGHRHPLVCNDKYAALYVVSRPDPGNTCGNVEVARTAADGAASFALQRRRNYLYVCSAP